MENNFEEFKKEVDEKLAIEMERVNNEYGVSVGFRVFEEDGYYGLNIVFCTDCGSVEYEACSNMFDDEMIPYIEDELHDYVVELIGKDGKIVVGDVDVSGEEFWTGAGVYCRSIIRKLEMCHGIMHSIIKDMDAAMDECEDVYDDCTVEREIYKLCKKTMAEIEELRTMDNPDV